MQDTLGHVNPPYTGSLRADFCQAIRRHLGLERDFPPLLGNALVSGSCLESFFGSV